MQQLWADNDPMYWVQKVNLLHGSGLTKCMPGVGCSDQQTRLCFLLQLLLYESKETNEGMFVQQMLASGIDVASLAEDGKAVTPC